MNVCLGEAARAITPWEKAFFASGEKVLAGNKAKGKMNIIWVFAGIKERAP
jgi:hypothetical protein